MKGECGGPLQCIKARTFYNIVLSVSVYTGIILMELYNINHNQPDCRILVYTNVRETKTQKLYKRVQLRHVQSSKFMTA